MFRKSVDELVVIANEKEQEFRTKYGYDATRKIRAKAKKLAFIEESKIANNYLSKFMDELLMNKFNELSSDDKLRNIKLRWGQSNQVRADFISDVAEFKKIEKSTEPMTKKKRQASATKKTVRTPKPNVLESDKIKYTELYPYLYRLETEFKRKFDGKLTDNQRILAHTCIDEIMTDIDNIRVRFDNQLNGEDILSVNMKSRIYGFGDMLRQHVDAITQA